MTEEFLHHLWRFKLLKSKYFRTAKSETVEILNFGQYNTNSGPDFFNAQVLFNGIKWAGNIEIHINSSDWNKHNHHQDNAYNNVVLHVVYNNDAETIASSGRSIPVIEIKELFDSGIYQRYLNIVQSNNTIPCSKQFNHVSEVVMKSWLERCAIDRLEQKADFILKELEQTNGNWEEVCYRLLARNFGFKTNAEPFYLLAKYLPLGTLQKHASTVLQTEALLFGTAGFLSKSTNDEYVRNLFDEFNYAQKKLNLTTLDFSLWKFLRMRPANFPTIRIAQFANLFYSHPRIFTRLLEAKSVDELYSLFCLPASDYWNNHLLPDKKSKQIRIKQIGTSSVNNIIINTIAPLLFVYGKYSANQKYIDLSLFWLNNVSPEKNSKIKAFTEVGFVAKSALETQALIQIKNNFCDKKQCLNCAVGHAILSKK